jgi:hypothetical protein
MWTSALVSLFAHGMRSVDGRNSVETLELIGFSTSMRVDLGRTVLRNTVRKASPAFMSAETLWYLSAAHEFDMLLPFAPAYPSYIGNPKTNISKGAYGPRLHSGLKDVVHVLKDNPTTRQAVVSVFNSSDLSRAAGRDTCDIPCTTSLQFLIRDNELHLVTTMRSNDVWVGFPNDVFAFTTIQGAIACELGIKPGHYIHNVGSLHLYAKDTDKARNAFDTQFKFDKTDEPEFAWSKLSTLQYAAFCLSLISSGVTTLSTSALLFDEGTLASEMLRCTLRHLGNTTLPAPVTRSFA